MAAASGVAVAGVEAPGLAAGAVVSEAGEELAGLGKGGPPAAGRVTGAGGNGGGWKCNGNEPTEYWLGTNNFFAITQYNRSFFYAMPVVDLGRAVRAARGR